MNWRQRLALKREESWQKCPDGPPPKLTKPPFVGFASTPDGHSRIIVPAVRDDLRGDLLAQADRLAVERMHVHRLDDGGLRMLAAIGQDGARAYLLAAADAATRQAGKVPERDTTAIYCAHCGPVFAHPDIATMLPVVNGWPRALGCSWCFVRKVGGYIPRPRVTCEGCRHFTPDTINPAAGMGKCASGRGTFYPMQRRGCGDFNLP